MCSGMRKNEVCKGGKTRERWLLSVVRDCKHKQETPEAE